MYDTYIKKLKDGNFICYTSSELPDDTTGIIKVNNIEDLNNCLSLDISMKQDITDEYEIDNIGEIGEFIKRKNIYIPSYIKIDNDTFYVKDLLGSGTSGVVFSYKSLTTSHQYAVKVLKSDDAVREKFVLEYIESKNIDCRLTKYKFISEYVNPDNGTSYTYFLASEMSGSLNDPKIKCIISNLPRKQQLNIFLDIAKQLECLYLNGLVYTDVKEDNIFFRYINRDKIILSLGDLGGFVVPREHTQYTYASSTELIKFNKKEKNTVTETNYNDIENEDERKELIEWDKKERDRISKLPVAIESPKQKDELYKIRNDYLMLFGFICLIVNISQPNNKYIQSYMSDDKKIRKWKADISDVWIRSIINDIDNIINEPININIVVESLKKEIEDQQPL